MVRKQAENANMSKKLKYVKVYDTLFSKIQSGELPQGSCLPSEPELAKQMGVSRMTLRQALSLLQDDHLIKNIRGKGNYVMGNHAYPGAGLETFSHPVYLCCKEPITEVELDMRIDVPSEYYVQNLGRKASAIVVCNRWYKNGDTPVAYSFSFLPIEVATQMELDLSDSGQVKSYLERGLYQTGAYSVLALSHTTTGSFMPVKYQLSGTDSYMMAYEKVYGARDEVLAVSKHYIPAGLCEMVVCAKAAPAKL